MGPGHSIATICRRLRQLYGPATAPRQLDPVGELIFTILSQNTTDTNSMMAFEALRRRFPNWDAVRRARVSSIIAAIRRAGLGQQKAPRIKTILQEIRDRHGKLSLEFLHRMPTDAARAYLERFVGVGPKTAACVLLFACGKPVLPVDTHVQRVSERLGLIPKGTGADKAHDLLRPQVDAKYVLEFHVQLIRHGRRICVARNPRCVSCVLLDGCPEGQAHTRRSEI